MQRTTTMKTFNWIAAAVLTLAGAAVSAQTADSAPAPTRRASTSAKPTKKSASTRASPQVR
jgi:hypothetical protein